MKNIIITESQFKSLIEQNSLNLKGKTIAPGISAKHSSNYVSKDEENLFITAFNKIISSHKFTLPIHVRAYIYHLLGRTTPFTEKDMTTEERVFLKKAALSVSERGFDYNFWSDYRNPQDPTGAISDTSIVGLINMPMVDQFSNFLGQVGLPNIRISPDKNKVTVIDNYDFNVKRDNLSNNYITKNFFYNFKSFIKDPTELYGLIRNIANMREAGGYNGYPVNINL
jgi:hypothetical protein